MKGCEQLWGRPPVALALASTEVHVWCAQLDLTDEPFGKKGANYAAFFRGVTNVWGVSPWIGARAWRCWRLCRNESMEMLGETAKDR